MANPVRNRFRVEMEFDTPLTYDQFRVAMLRTGIAIQTAESLELVYLATRKADFAEDIPIDCR